MFFGDDDILLFLPLWPPPLLMMMMNFFIIIDTVVFFIIIPRYNTRFLYPFGSIIPHQEVVGTGKKLFLFINIMLKLSQLIITNPQFFLTTVY